MISKALRLYRTALVVTQGTGTRIQSVQGSIIARSFAANEKVQNQAENAKTNTDTSGKTSEFIEVVNEKTYKVGRNSLTPHQLWLTSGKGMERPYTGDYWDNNDVGHYECVVCSNKLFL